MTKTYPDRHPRSGAMGNLPWTTPTVTRVRHRSTLTELGWSLLAIVLGFVGGFVLGACYLIGSAR